MMLPINNKPIIIKLLFMCNILLVYLLGEPFSLSLDPDLSLDLDFSLDSDLAWWFRGLGVRFFEYDLEFLDLDLL